MPNPLDWLRKKLAAIDRAEAAKTPDGAASRTRAPSRRAQLLGPDRFRVDGDHPRREQHLLLDALVTEWCETSAYYGTKLASLENGAVLAALKGPAAAQMVVAADERWLHAHEAERTIDRDHGYSVRNHVQRATHEVRETLIRRKQPLTDEHLQSLIATRVHAACPFYTVACGYLVKAIERRFKEGEPSAELRAAVVTYRNTVDTSVRDVDQRRFVPRLDVLLGRETPLRLDDRQRWVQSARAHLAALDEGPRAAWTDLLEHAQKARASKPSARWTKRARETLDAIGDDAFAAAVIDWFGLFGNRSGEGRFHGEDAARSQDTLKGLAWACGALKGDRPEVARALAALARAALHTDPGYGPRSGKIANAAIHTLGALPGLAAVGQLALLRIRVKHKPTLKGIDKALTCAAEREGLPRDELEEMAVPAYGLSEVGVHTEELGGYTAELRVTGTSTTALTWRHTTKDGREKTQKSVPAAVKRDHPDELKALKATAKDIQKMVPAQRDRIDALFLSRRTWPLATWRERYLDHPLVGTLARRIIWSITDGGTETPVCWKDGALIAVDDAPLGDVADGATVALWHPIGHAIEDVIAWREWLERHGVIQPFKQAHREVYLLTDAERATGVYSNRFASHVLKQHQFHALCAVRAWSNRLRMMVDDEYPPATRELPEWGVRAEFWVEGIGDDWQTDANEAGAYLRIATDQVRFYPIDAAVRTAHAGGGGYQTQGVAGSDTPVPLDDVPPLLLSEVLRDVDLFVGVASVGNDPTWQDGGPEGRYRTYWENYSFGELSGTAQTRRVFLERLVPRLKIADVCTVTDRFLEVQGKLRGYRIHLGSGNILMTPNDQYLCIVPGRGAVKGAAGKVMLPFEGDRTLSIILSKAFMLAADDKITDSTIVSQIRR